MAQDDTTRFNPGHTMDYVTFGEMLLARLGEQSTGLMFHEQRWTWDEFVRESAIRAAVLSELAGELAERIAARPEAAHRTLHVGVLLDNVPEYLFLFSGAALAGVTIVGINPTRRGAELAADIRGADCDVVFTQASGLELLAGMDPTTELGLAREPIRIDTPDWQDRLDRFRDAASKPEAQLTEQARDPSTILALMFTSGSTGAPKAVICGTGRMAMLGQVNFRGLVPSDVAYSAMPLFHGNAMMGSFAPCVAVGCAFSMRERFSASNFLPDVLAYGATFANYVGRSLAYILAVPESPAELTTKLRIVFGTEASAHDRAEFERRYGVAPSEAYGSSEGAVVIQRTPDTPADALGISGDYMDVRILAPDGSECPPAQWDAHGVMLNADEAIGEIVNLSGAAMFEGYYRNPEATAERIDGVAYRSGDLGYTDADGFIYFAGRSGDRIRVDSENFSAAPIERILARFPGVLVVAVYPVPDPHTGDAVMAAIQMVPGYEFEPEDFARFLDTQPDLGTKWRPTFVRITAAMPTTATRKIAKPVLRRASWEVTDPVFVDDDGSYVLLDSALARQLHETYAKHGRAVQGY